MAVGTHFLDQMGRNTELTTTRLLTNEPKGHDRLFPSEWLDRDLWQSVHHSTPRGSGRIRHSNQSGTCHEAWPQRWISINSIEILWFWAALGQDSRLLAKLNVFKKTLLTVCRLNQAIHAASPDRGTRPIDRRHLGDSVQQPEGREVLALHREAERAGSCCGLDNSHPGGWTRRKIE
jgi:hypothetical protein